MSLSISNRPAVSVESMHLWNRMNSAVVTASQVALAVVAAASIGLSLEASAQAPPDDLQEVLVTSSRVVRDGYNAPTPVTVLGAEQIAAAAAPNIFTVVNQLPSLAGSVSPQVGNVGSSGGTGGISALGLRGLGTNRTLVLIDGQRFIGASLTGIVDVSQLPQTLITRVDVVTGGASADWGSDAVAGVVNFITDKKFAGIKADVSGGMTTYHDNEQYRVALTGGLSLFGGKGHLVVAGEQANTAGIVGNPRPWYTGRKILVTPIAQTPAGQPQITVADHIGSIQIAPGGLITAGPLQGTAFGASGATYAFQYGSPIVSPLMVGGARSSDIGDISNLDDQLLRKTLYGRFTYDVTDQVSAWISANYAGAHSNYQSGPHYKTANLTMRKDNPYLPASIVNAMTTANITTFQFGTLNQDIGPFRVDNNRIMGRVAAGLDGKSKVFGVDWTWNAYVETARNQITNRNPNETITPFYNLAIDAVRSPSGSIVCRSTLTNPANGCQPLNIFGTGVASPAGLAYVTGEPYLYTTQSHSAAAFTFSGEPFALPSGPVSIASGIEYRREGFHSIGDPISEGNAGNPDLAAAGNNWFTGNFHGSRGTYDVYEGFLETVVPLIKSATLGAADLNAAARRTHYSTAGSVTTWKLGLTYSPVDDIRLRGTVSRDIRAPNLGELFQAPQVFTQTVVDDFPPFAGQTFTIQRPQVGNVNLQPEIADSLELGIVLKPRFIEGLHLSFDYYRIKLKNVVATLSNQQTMDLCFQGNQTLCSLITRNAAGQVTSLTVQAINLASQLNRGFDIEADYALALNRVGNSLAGSVNFRVLATHIINNRTDSGIPNNPIVDIAGQNSSSSPNWRILATQNYSSGSGALSVALTERWISSGVNNTLWIECTSGCPVSTINNPTVNNNHIDGAFYLDFGGTYRFNAGGPGLKTELYAKVDNALNKAPPPVAGGTNLTFLNTGANPTLFDTIGRTYRLGVRLQY